MLGWVARAPASLINFCTQPARRGARDPVFRESRVVSSSAKWLKVREVVIWPVRSGRRGRRFESYHSDHVFIRFFVLIAGCSRVNHRFDHPIAPVLLADGCGRIPHVVGADRGHKYPIEPVATCQEPRGLPDGGVAIGPGCKVRGKAQAAFRPLRLIALHGPRDRILPRHDCSATAALLDLVVHEECGLA